MGMANDETIVRAIKEVFQWRRRRQEAWEAENFRGEDRQTIETQLDAEGFSRIRTIVERSK